MMCLTWTLIAGVIDAKQVPTRFLRCYSAGSEISNGNLYVEIEAWGREPEGS